MASLRCVVASSMRSVRMTQGRGLPAMHGGQPSRMAARRFASSVPVAVRLLREQLGRVQPRRQVPCLYAGESGVLGAPVWHRPSRATTARTPAIGTPLLRVCVPHLGVVGVRMCSSEALGARISSAAAAGTTTAPVPSDDAATPRKRRGRAAVESAEAQAKGKSTQHVRSFFVAASIDVDDLLRRLPSQWLRKTGKNSAMLTLKAADRPVPDAMSLGSTIPWEDSHVSVFQRGAMVFLNCDFPTYLEVFNLVKKANHSAVRPEYGEDCVVEVDPEFPAWSALEGEVLRVQSLDLDNIAVLNSVMGQTVILDYYERQVDSMLDTVQDLNRAIENKDSSKLKANHLYNALTRVNDISIQVIMSGLRNKFRPGTAAWKEEKYFTMQQTLWEQYELEERYEQLEGKVTYINDVIKYCLEVQKENKFLRLERMIVYLITIELFVSLLHTPGVMDTLAEWWTAIRAALAA